MKDIKLKISEKDKVLYEYLKNCKDEKMVKFSLTTAVELYNYCTGKYELCKGFPSPESFKKSLQNVSNEKLKEFKKKYEQEIIEWASTFDPDQVDCGVMRGPDDDKYWFVEEYGPLGFITLYSHYIKKVEEVLNERNK